MKRIRNSDISSIYILLLMFVLGILFFFIGLYKYGNTLMEVKEYVYDWSLTLGTNAELEGKIFWGLIFCGIIVLICIHKYIIKESVIKVISDTDMKIIVFSIISVSMYIYNGTIAYAMVYLLLLIALNKIVFKSSTEEYIYLYILLTLSLSILSYILISSVNIKVIFLVSFTIVSLVLLYIKQSGKNILNRFSLIVSLIVPLSFFLYIKNTYIYNGKIENIYNNRIINSFFLLLVLALVTYNIYYMFKEWNAKNLSISLITVISVTSIISYSRVSKIVYDAHHLAEEILPYNQIFGYGNIPYVDYFPVSGLFPIGIGAIQKIFGLKLTETNLAVAIFGIICSIIVVLLLDRYLERKELLFLVVLFPTSNIYIRTNLLIIYFLILFLPFFKNKIGYWIEVWGISTYILVFFYPLFGIAAFLGTLPFTIYKLFIFVRDKEYKKEFRNPIFLIFLFLEICILILSFKSIIGLIVHILTYSDQGILCNAWASFGQKIPEDFMLCLKGFQGIRYGLWYSIRYMLIILVVWIMFLLFIHRVKNIKSLNAIYEDSPFILFSGIITLLISCTLTIKRQDQEWLLSRTGWVLFPTISIIILLVIFKYMQKTYMSSVFIGILASICGMALLNPLYFLDNVYYKNENVDSQNYIYMDNPKYKNLGKGYIPKYMINDLDKYYTITQDIKKYDDKISFLGLHLGYISALDLKTTSQPSLSAVMTYKQSKKLIEEVKNTKAIVFNELLSPTIMHNLCKWLLTTDEYIYVRKWGAFVPKEKAKIFEVEGDDKRGSIWDTTELDNNAATAGKSFDYLKPNYDDTNLEFTYTEPTSYSEIINNDTKEVSNVSEINIDFNREITGLEGNYLYLDLQRDNGNISNLDSIEDKFMRHFTKEQINEKCTLNISWIGEEGRANFINCKMSDGRVFIPLEANTNWLLNSHKGIKVKVFGLDEGEKIHINSCEMMKSKDL